MEVSTILLVTAKAILNESVRLIFNYSCPREEIPSLFWMEACFGGPMQG